MSLPASRRAALAAACLSLAVLAGTVAHAAPAGAAAPLRSQRTPVGGLDPATWTERWWQWALSFPEGLEPYTDRDGSRCAMGQDEDAPVWFLAGTDGSFHANRRCRVPLGKHVLVPVINKHLSMPRTGPYAAGCAAMREQVGVHNERLVSAVVLLDGRRVDADGAVRLRSPDCYDPATGESPSAGDWHAAADGYWVLLPPLPAGLHRLSIGANYAGKEGDGSFGGMVQNFEYELQVGDPAI